MIKAAIIGCGIIAEQHAEQIQRIQEAKLVGFCDREILMAKQMSERFDTKDRYFVDPHELLEKCRPDVVHITTPPQSHFELGKLCLEEGCNVYIEKPFTLNTKEAEELINLANDKKLKVTVGHNLQYSHATIRMRELIKKGYLGGEPVHMESIYCYDFGDVRYAKVLLGDKNHWIRKLPGKLLHNIISHGVCKIAEFLTSDSPKVIAHGFSSPFLRRIGESDIVDELRVIINDNEKATAYFTFSSQMSPKRRQFRIYGPKNAIFVDDDHQTVITHRGAKYKSYLDQFLPPWSYARQYISNSVYNVRKFVQKDFHMSSGMKKLIEGFYSSISGNTAPPISYKEIILTSKIMDDIFSQIYPYRQ